MKKNRPVIVIRKSCITGKVVWMYQGPCRAAARCAYYRACKKEVARVRYWLKTVARRRENILRMLDKTLARIPINAELSSDQRAAALQLQRIAKDDYPCHREFYEHIMEERRRRRERKTKKKK